MSIWGYGPVSFVVTGGAANLLELKVPHRGTIREIRLKQIGGAEAGSFEIFDAQGAAEAVSAPLDGVAAVTSLGDPASHSVTGSIAYAAGTYSSGEIERTYINRDGSYTAAIRRLWARLSPGGAGEQTYELTMIVELNSYE